jgi:hypothetical protein
MRLEKYETEIDNTSTIYEFVSESVEYSIKKRVIYQQIDNSIIYNLAFGDVNELTDELDDTIVSNNGDTEKVLATVAATVYYFFDKYPKAILFAKGNSVARNRLYKIGISNNLEELKKDFIVMGLGENKEWKIFDKNEIFSAFYVKKIR